VGGAYGTYGRQMSCIIVFGGETRGKSSLARPRRKWKDNIKTHFQEVGWEGMGWIDLTQDRSRWWALMKAVMDLRVPYNAGSVLTSRITVSFSERTLFHGVIYIYTLGISVVPEDVYKI